MSTKSQASLIPVSVTPLSTIGDSLTPISRKDNDITEIQCGKAVIKRNQNQFCYSLKESPQTLRIFGYDLRDLKTLYSKLHDIMVLKSHNFILNISVMVNETQKDYIISDDNDVAVLKNKIESPVLACLTLNNDMYNRFFQKNSFPKIKAFCQDTKTEKEYTPTLVDAAREIENEKRIKYAGTAKKEVKIEDGFIEPRIQNVTTANTVSVEVPLRHENFIKCVLAAVRLWDLNHENTGQSQDISAEQILRVTNMIQTDFDKKQTN